VLDVSVGSDHPSAFADVLDEADAIESPHVLCGSVDAVCDRLEERRARWGISYLVCHGPEAMRRLAPVVARLSGR
jgi:hypothetical protein